MEPNKKITVEIAYASEHKQLLLRVEVEQGGTLEKAIHCSGILEHFPEIDLSKQKIGIFSEQKQLADRVNPGDRIEIYRPLLIDPKDARKRRAKKKG